MITFSKIFHSTIGRALLILVLLPAVLLLSSCGSDDQLTGGTAASEAVRASTLLVSVQAEDGSLLSDAEVFVNNEFKGKTLKYGEIGTRKVVLTGAENLIQVEKDGFVPAEVRSISAVSAEQRITFVLEKKKAALRVEVEENGSPIADARVTLHQKKIPLNIETTDDDGEVVFSQLDDDAYSITAVKEGYEPVQETIRISYSENPSPALALELLPLPSLSVTVKDTSGRPLGFTEVSLYTRGGFHSPGEAVPIEREFTNVAGEVVFTAVEYDGRYVVSVKREGFFSESAEILLEPDNRHLEFMQVFDIE